MVYLMPVCEYCGKEVAIPFRCKYCGKIFCAEHHLPEAHNCPNFKRGAKFPLDYMYYKTKPVSYVENTERVAHKIRPKFRIKWYKNELKALAIAVFATCLVYVSYMRFAFIYTLFILISVIIAFLFHELAHKFVAMNLGHIAFFKLSSMGLAITLISAIPFLPFKFIGPGYVSIIPNYYKGLTKDDMLKIAAAGPLTNIVIALIGILGYSLLSNSLSFLFFYILAVINADIAIFNLLPFPILDGEKIFRSNVVAWVVLFIIATLLWIKVHIF